MGLSIREYAFQVSNQSCSPRPLFSLLLISRDGDSKNWTGVSCDYIWRVCSAGLVLNLVLILQSKGPVL